MLRRYQHSDVCLRLRFRFRLLPFYPVVDGILQPFASEALVGEESYGDSVSLLAETFSPAATAEPRCPSVLSPAASRKVLLQTLAPAEVGVTLVPRPLDPTWDCPPCTAGAYHAAASTLARTSRFGPLQKLLAEMNCCGLCLRPATANIVISGYGRAGLVDKVMDLVNSLPRLGCTPNVLIYNNVLSILVKAKRWGQAQAIYQEMLASRSQPDIVTYNTLIHGLMKERKVADALKLYCSIAERGFPTNPITDSVLISGLCDAGCPAAAFRHLEESRKKGRQSSIRVMKKLLVCLCQASELKEACRLLELIEEVAIPDPFSYTLVLYALMKSSANREIQDVLRRLREREAALSSASAPDVLFYLGQQGLGTDVIALLEYCSRKGLTLPSQTHSRLFLAVLGSGKLQDALHLLFKLLDLGLVVAKSLDWDAAFSIALERLCVTGKLEDALSLFGALRSRSLDSPSTNSILLRSLCKGLRLDSAYRLCHGSFEEGSRVENAASDLVIASLCKGAKYREVFDLFDCAERTGSELKPNSYNAALHLLCKQGRLEQACRLLKEMVGRGRRPDVFTYCIMIHSLCKVNKLRQSYELLSAMRKAGCEPDAACYTSLIDANEKAGKRTAALKLLYEMLAVGVELDIRVYNSLMAGFLKAGQAGKALELWDKIRRHTSFVPTEQSYQCALDAMLKSNKVSQALRTVEEMLAKKLFPDASICRRLQLSISMDETTLEIPELLHTLRNLGFDIYRFH